MTDPPTDHRRLRRLAKLPLFLLHGSSWRKARWLARHDAAWRENFRPVALRDLVAAWAAVGGWDDLVVNNGRVFSRLLTLPLDAGSTAVAGYATLRFIRQRGFVLEDCGEFIAAANPEVRLRLTNTEEVDMLREIFLEGCYDLRPSGRWLVLDVGANVGFASLYFAGRTWTDRIIAFEPFAPTAAGFAANLALNPKLAEKISLQPHGWSDRDTRGTVAYNRANSGSMRTEGLDSTGSGPTDDQTRETIQLARAATVFDRLTADLAGRRVLLKLDCEGSEFPILRDLEETRLLARVDVLVLEWHYQPPDEVVERLQRTGFTLQVRPVRESATQGVLLAWRQGRNS